MTNAILWVEFVIFSVFVGLRLYTRKEILNAVGPDDYLTVIALAVHILYTIFVTIATTYSLGRLFAEAEYPATYFTAVKYELFSQAAGLMSIGIGNWLSACFFFGSCRIKPRSGLSGCALRLLFPLLYSLPLRLLYSVCRLRRAGIQRCQDHVGWISPRLDILLDRGSSPPTSPLPFFRGSSFGS